LGFPFTIYTIASDFKFGTQLGLTKAHHEIPQGRKSGRDRGPEDLPKILPFPFNICATAKASMHLEFAKAHHTTTPRREVGVRIGLWKLPNIWDSHVIFPRCALSVSGASCFFYG